MNLTNLKKIFLANGCKKIYAKTLAQNDLSKSQVYFGGSFDVLNIFPIEEITTDSSGDWDSERFKATLGFSWIQEDGSLSIAPHAKLILYPAYPEVRFSGFLKNSRNAPSLLMNMKIGGRILFMGVSGRGTVLGYVVGPDSEIANEFNSIKLLHESIFSVIELEESQNNREKLLAELLRIYNLGWIRSKRLNNKGEVLPCNAPNCGGYTLEAELGITPNGYSEPDFLGWEIKQFGVANFEKINSKIITLMTPEPTHGIYKTDGAEAFIRKYGYPDVSGKPDRINFGGIHKSGINHPKTNLTLELIGFDNNTGKIRNADGRIALIDKDENETASWSFASLLKHWNRKHNQACYIPSQALDDEGRNYKYGNNIILGSGTDFQLFLKEMSIGHIYYDPGIKMENMSTKPLIKKRSQFRIAAGNLGNLYKNQEFINISKV